MMLVIVFIVGVLVGTNAFALWLHLRLRKPEVAVAFLKNAWRVSHAHWLQVSKEDDTLVCPCCGFSEERRRSAIFEDTLAKARASLQ
jgi:hypothetical protein